MQQMKRFVKRVELVANLAIIVVAILLGMVLVRNYLFRSSVHKVLPQTILESEEYLNGLVVNVDDVKQSELASLGVSSTPPLILLNDQGIVEYS